MLDAPLGLQDLQWPHDCIDDLVVTRSLEEGVDHRDLPGVLRRTSPHVAHTDGIADLHHTTGQRHLAEAEWAPCCTYPTSDQRETHLRGAKCDAFTVDHLQEIIHILGRRAGKYAQPLLPHVGISHDAKIAAVFPILVESLHVLHRFTAMPCTRYFLFT